MAVIRVSYLIEEATAPDNIAFEELDETCQLMVSTRYDGSHGGIYEVSQIVVGDIICVDHNMDIVHKCCQNAQRTITAIGPKVV